MGDGGTRRRGKACESGCQMVDISQEVQLSGILSVLKSSLVRFFTSKRGNWQPQPV
jgi:hypothetical protein